MKDGIVMGASLCALTSEVLNKAWKNMELVCLITNLATLIKIRKSLAVDGRVASAGPSNPE